MSNINNIEYCNRLGLSFFKKKEYQSALYYFNWAEDLNREEPSIHYNLAKCYLQLGEYKKAHLSSCNAIRLAPDNPKYNYVFFTASITLGDLFSAETALPHIKQIVTAVEFNKAKEKIEQIKDYTKRLESAKKCNDFAKIVYNCDKLLGFARGATHFKIPQAEALIILGKYEEARILANSILLYENKNVDALFIIATCTYYEGDIETSINMYKKVLKLMPEHQNYTHMYNKVILLRDTKMAGSKAFSSNDLTGALNHYNEALEIDKYNSKVNAQLNYNIALIYMKRNKFIYAIERATDAIKLDQSYLKAYLLRAKCYMKMELYEEASCDAKVAYELHPTLDIKQLIEAANKELRTQGLRDSYDILGIDQNADEKAVQKAYRTKALLYHPDRHHHCSQTIMQFLEKKFKEVYNAYKVILAKITSKNIKS